MRDKRKIEVADQEKYQLINDACFRLNAIWWRTPGTKHEDSFNPLLGYDRNEILIENPNSQLLVKINQHAITTNGQDANTDRLLFRDFPPDFENQSHTARRDPRV